MRADGVECAVGAGRSRGCSRPPRTLKAVTAHPMRRNNSLVSHPAAERTAIVTLEHTMLTRAPTPMPPNTSGQPTHQLLVTVNLRVSRAP
ncbi:hypothetical protein PJI17_15590 [Mycobacterium kansasii]